MNKTELVANNNKFYVMQIVQKSNGAVTGLYSRYGRVGDRGVENMDYCDIESAKKKYVKTVKQKTGKSKGYIAIKMKTAEEKEATKNLAAGSSSAAKDSSKANDYAESKLEPSVKRLIDFIYDKDLMDDQMTRQGFDVKKLPLEDLAEETVM